MTTILESIAIVLAIAIAAYSIGIIVLNLNHYFQEKITSKGSVKTLHYIDKFLT